MFIVPVGFPVVLRDMFSSFVYLAMMRWMLLSLNSVSTAGAGFSAAELSLIKKLDGEETLNKSAPCPSQRLSEGDLSKERRAE